MNRRGFLSSLIAVPAAAFLAPSIAPSIQFWPEQNPTMYYAPGAMTVNLGQAVAEAWEAYVGADQADNIFILDRNAPLYLESEVR